jgi:hypothetical protein
LIEFDPPRARVVSDGRGGYQVSQSQAWVKFATEFRYELHKFKGAKASVFLCICFHVDEHNNAFPSLDTIASETGYTTREVIDTIKELENILGVLSVVREHRKVNTYHVNAFVAYGSSTPQTLCLGEETSPKPLGEAGFTQTNSWVNSGASLGEAGFTPSRTSKENHKIEEESSANAEAAPSASFPASPPAEQVTEQAPLFGKPIKAKKDGAKKRTEADPRSESPQVQMFKRITGHYPPKEHYDAIINAIGQRNEVAVKAYYAEWLKVSPNTYNLTWVLEWLVSGKPPGECRTRKGIVSAPTSPPQRKMVRADLV